MEQKTLNLLLQQEDGVALLFTNLLNDYYQSNFQNQNDEFEDEQLAYLFYLTKLGCLLNSYNKTNNRSFREKVRKQITLTIDKIDVLKDGEVFA